MSRNQTPAATLVARHQDLTPARPAGYGYYPIARALPKLIAAVAVDQPGELLG